MSTDEKMCKEIDLIQGCINRMCNNSFMCKGWLLSIIIAILALLPENINRKSICIIIILANICFWWLDSYYLQQEKFYRWKYEWVIANRMSGELKFLYDLNPLNKEMWMNHNLKENIWLKIMLWNKSITPLYGGITAIALYIISK